MPKSKKPRHKKRQERDTKPSWTYDAIGNPTKNEIKKLLDISDANLALLRLGSSDDTCSSDIFFALRHFWCCANYFKGDTENKLLATMATASVHAMRDMIEAEHKGIKRNEEAFRSVFEPLDHAMNTYFEMLKNSYRSENVFAIRQAKRMSLSRALLSVAVGGVAIIYPEKKNEVIKHKKQHGVAYVHGRCEVGYIEDHDGKLFWRATAKDILIRIERPTLVFFVEKQKQQTSTTPL